VRSLEESGLPRYLINTFLQRMIWAATGIRVVVACGAALSR
jgi:hypothetical protein